MKVNIDKEKVTGAIVVLENYLDGAISDFENGDVENTAIIEDCIYAHRILDLVLTGGWISLENDKYEERFNEVNKKYGSI